MKKLLLTAATLVALASPAAAEPLTGGAVIKECLAASGFCNGLMFGVAAASQVCVPKGVTLVQMRNVVLEHLAHKEAARIPVRNQVGWKLVLEAFNDAWPCSKTTIAEKQKQRQVQEEFDEYLRKQRESERAQSSTDPDTPPGNPSEMDVMVAFGMAVTIEYVKCGGQISTEQKVAVKTALAERGPLIAYFSKEFGKTNCSDTIRAYHKMVTELTK